VLLNKVNYIQIDREVSASNFELSDTIVDDDNRVEEVGRVVGERGVKWGTCQTVAGSIDALVGLGCRV
jgi:hypothetical protein